VDVLLLFSAELLGLVFSLIGAAANQRRGPTSTKGRSLASPD